MRTQPHLSTPVLAAVSTTAGAADSWTRPLPLRAYAASGLANLCAQNRSPPATPTVPQQRVLPLALCPASPCSPQWHSAPATLPSLCSPAGFNQAQESRTWPGDLLPRAAVLLAPRGPTLGWHQAPPAARAMGSRPPHHWAAPAGPSAGALSPRSAGCRSWPHQGRPRWPAGQKRTARAVHGDAAWGFPCGCVPRQTRWECTAGEWRQGGAWAGSGCGAGSSPGTQQVHECVHTCTKP